MSAKYLNIDNTLNRLLAEYEEHGKIIVAYDFDDTVCTYTPGAPEPTLEREANEEICQLLRDLCPYAEFIVWTCRHTKVEPEWDVDDGINTALSLATTWLDNHNVPYDYVNQDAEVSYGGRKIYCNILLDDRAGLATAYEVLRQFLKIVKSNFNARKAKETIIKSIRDYFDNNGDGDEKAIIGISGGTDSTVAAALAVEALGRHRVLGLLLPDGEQIDFYDSIKLCQELAIPNAKINIKHHIDSIINSFGWDAFNFSGDLLKNNVPALVRRNILATAAMLKRGRVINTTNKTEEYLGYITKHDNIVGDFAPFLNYTKSEVIEIGLLCPVSKSLVTKPPSDGMCGMTDEERLGFSYAQADSVIRGTCTPMTFRGFDVYKKDKIDRMHCQSEFKRRPIARAPYIN